jgi:hypothetical protein
VVGGLRCGGGTNGTQSICHIDGTDDPDSGSFGSL